MLKVCETTVRPEAEPIPKISLRRPNVAESSSSLAVPSQAQPRLKLTSPSPAPLGRHRSGSHLFMTLSAAGALTALMRISMTADHNQMPYDELPLAELGLGYGAGHGHGQGESSRSKKIKVKPPAKADPAQANGMSLGDVSACKSMVKKLLREKCSLIFRHPVDPVKSGAPG